MMNDNDIFVIRMSSHTDADIIIPYLPTYYSTKSIHKILQILKTTQPNRGILASLDIFIHKRPCR